MRTFILAAAAVLTLGTSAAFAQGLPPGAASPDYGSHAFPAQPYHNAWIFSRLFSHSTTDRVAVQHTATQGQGS